MTKIIFIDFDDTLFSHFSKSVPESAIKAIDLLHNSGIKVFLSTGRSLAELEYFGIDKIKYDGIIANNGQICYDNKGEAYFDYPIDGELKEKIVAMFKEKRVPLVLNTEERLIINMVNDTAIQRMKSIDTPVPDVVTYTDQKFYMCSYLFDSPDEFYKLGDIRNLGKISYWHNGDCDIVDKTMNKGIAVKKLIEILGIDKKDTMCIGDSKNDIEMFENCEISIAMGNASDDLKSISTYVTDHIDKDGLYKACKHFELI